MFPSIVRRCGNESAPAAGQVGRGQAPQRPLSDDVLRRIVAVLLDELRAFAQDPQDD